MNHSAGLFTNNQEEMMQLIANKHWAIHPLGEISSWPSLLKTTLNLILHSRHPMVLYWGREMYTFYNKAFIPSLGKEKHPKLLGEPVKKFFSEAYEFIESATKDIWAGKTSQFYEDLLIPIERNGKLEDVYWTFSYSPVQGEDGNIEGIILIVTEETEKVKARKSLEIERTKFAQTVMNAPMAMALLSHNMRFEMANDAYLKLIQKTRAEVLGNYLYEVLPEVRDYVKEILQNVVNTGETFKAQEFEVAIFRNEKLEKAWFNLIYQPVKDTEGKTVSIVVLAVEITDMILSRNKLKAEEERQRLSIESSNNATWDYDLVTGEVIHSENLCDIFGYSKDTNISYPMLLSHIDDADKKMVIQDAYIEAWRSGNYKYRAKIKTLDGKTKWIETQGRTLRNDPKEKPSRMLGLMKDITDLVVKEQEIIKNNLRLKVALKATNLGTFEYSLKNMEFSGSERFFEILDYDSKEKLNTDKLNELVHPDFRETVYKAWQNAIKGADIHYQSKIITKKGEEKWIEVYGMLQYDETGHATTISGTLKDITCYELPKLKIQESELRYHFLADFIPQFIWSSDKDGVLNYWNKAVFDYTGYTLEQMANAPGWLSIVHPEDRKENIKNGRNPFKPANLFLVNIDLEIKTGNTNGSSAGQFHNTTRQAKLKGGLVPAQILMI